MKLTDITPRKGSYAGLRVLDPAANMLYEHVRAAGIPAKKSMFDRRLHTTLLYSRKHCPNLKAEPSEKHFCSFQNYDIFTGAKGEYVLVLVLNAPSVVARHLALMAEHGATYDFPIYHPHITLSYNYTDNSTAGIPPITFPITLGEEYVEDLDLDWK